MRRSSVGPGRGVKPDQGNFRQLVAKHLAHRIPEKRVDLEDDLRRVVPLLAIAETHELIPTQRLLQYGRNGGHALLGEGKRKTAASAMAGWTRAALRQRIAESESPASSG
jgi:hypothetical protein